MGSKLTNSNTAKTKGSTLSRRTNKEFQIVIKKQLDNRYCFKDLKENNLKEFHKFLDETVEKDLTISEVESLFLRNKGGKEFISIGDEEFQLVHFGKNRTKFRVFGYYDIDTNFVLTRIDPNHKTHKSN